jgi:hypothetical protein
VRPTHDTRNPELEPNSNPGTEPRTLEPGTRNLTCVDSELLNEYIVAPVTGR